MNRFFLVLDESLAGAVGAAIKQAIRNPENAEMKYRLERAYQALDKAPTDISDLDEYQQAINEGREL